MRRRWKGLCSLTIIVPAVCLMPGLARAAVRPGKQASDDPVRILRIYYQAPVLVKSGEPVAMPVQVVCVTARGSACEATLSLGVRAGTGDVWRFQRVEAEPDLSFDLSAPAARAAASSADQVVAFVLRAEAGNVTTSLPAGNAGPPLRFYATDEIRPVRIPPVPFGHVRKGRTVLSLPWGSGSKRAGLALGRESPTLGPPAFDVDRAGNVHLLDALQHRVARFKGNRLLGQRFIELDPDADLALGTGGVAFVAQTHKGTVGVRQLTASGRDSGAVSLGQGILSQVRVAGSTAYAELLPLDAWVRVPTPGSHGSQLAPIMGRPLPSGERLLRVGTERYVRLGMVRDGRVRKAIELRSDQRFGEVALAEPDGSGGYLVVVRMWQWRPKPADQFQVIHVSGGRVVETFAVSSRGFADTRPLSRFRLGLGGRLYQLVTAPSGIRVVRFQLRGES
jgi:hypothetical protein